MDILDLLNKLIAQEKSEREIGNMAAAETFAAKIAHLLTKHKLDMTDVEFAAEELNEPILAEEISVAEMLHTPQKTTHDSWLIILVNAVAEANFCKVLRETTARARVSRKKTIKIGPEKANHFQIVGRITDRTTTKTMFLYLMKACFVAATREAYLTGAAYDGRKKNFISGFKLGFAVAIAKRLAITRIELRAGATEQGLVRLNQIELKVKDAFADLFPDTAKAGCGQAPKDRTGFFAGKEYGEKVGINSTLRLNA